MASNPVRSQMDKSRKELLQLDRRNNLLNYKYRQKGIETAGAQPGAVFETLVLKGRAMSFRERAAETPSASARAEKGHATQLQSVETQDALDARLRAIERHARTSIEEQGVNTLFVALGMVTWYEDDSSQTANKAPLVLVPVLIQRKDINAPFQIEYDDEDVVTNESFREKMRLEFGLEIPLFDAEAENEAVQNLDGHFRQVSQRIRRQPRWAVDETSVVLGFFSFNKYLMYQDLDADRWPPGAGPEDNELMAALFGPGFTKEPPSNLSESDHLDERLPAEHAFHVLDADSSQVLAIEDMKAGRNLIIQGPPGTGKSQTITNIIAEAIGQGKTVLFVSEKKAALEVVKRRLDSIHLGVACLELHSHKTTKTAVLDELKRTQTLGQPDTQGVSAPFDRLNLTRQRLNAYSTAVNTPVGETDVTPHDAFGELLRLQQAEAARSGLPPAGSIEGSATWTPADFSRKREAVERCQERLASLGAPSQHPFWGTRLTRLLPSLRERLQRKCDETAQSLKALAQTNAQLGQRLHMPRPGRLAQTDVHLDLAAKLLAAGEFRSFRLQSSHWSQRKDDIVRLLDAGQRLTDLHSQYDSELTPEAWQEDGQELARVLRAHGRAWHRLLSADFRRANRQFKALCRSGQSYALEECLAILEAIQEAQRLQASIEQLAPGLDEIFGDHGQGTRTDWATVGPMARQYLELQAELENDQSASLFAQSLQALSRADLQALPALREAAAAARAACRTHAQELEALLELDPERFGPAQGLQALDYDAQWKTVRAWSDGIAELQEMVNFNDDLATLRQEGLAVIAELAVREPTLHHSLTAVLDKTRYQSILDRAYEERSLLSAFDLIRHHGDVETFNALDREALQYNRIRVTQAHWQGLPPADAGGAVGILRREFNKRRRQLPIRELMVRAGQAVQSIKPVFMMSPLSIATYLPAGQIKFDLVVFDEASQVKPVEALGALLRAEQAIVVGDRQQLPPTRFFDTDGGEDETEENAMADIENILGLFDAQGAPSRMLRWHYRSRHESLIAVSNQEFYENRLIVCPSPDKDWQNAGLRFHHLPDTHYDAGRSRTNRGEAQRVARAVMEHAAEHADLSLGVAAFSEGQSQAILDAVETLRRQNQDREAFFAAHPDEPFFVKNLENVQGDERDVIFISIGYGRDAHGRIAMRFGPLNNEGGHRRLNVLITRAKERCHVFSNIQAHDIDLGRTHARGVRALKTFLAFAETKELTDVPYASDRPAGSPFQQEVADQLRARGYTVHDEVASGGKFVDIGIVDPERPGAYLLGIECDGATYHSSRSARDRDRLRETLLRNLGWELHRIWSTDWFQNPGQAMDRAVEAIEQAKSKQRAQPASKPNAVPAPVPRPELKRQAVTVPSRFAEVRPYAYAEPAVQRYWLNQDSVPTRKALAQCIADIVARESPVHVSELMSRICRAGETRVTKTTRSVLGQAIRFATTSAEYPVAAKDGFLWSPAMTCPPVRDRSELPAAARKIDYIASEEIAEAVKLAVSHARSIEAAELPQEALRLLGFKRVTQPMRGRCEAVIKDLVAGKHLMTVDGYLMLP